MTEDNSPETQPELFTQFSSTPKRPERFPTLAKTQKPILISTNLEQLLMVSIIFILLFCGVFFLGVLRGKSLKQAPAVVGPLRQAQEPKALNTSAGRPVVVAAPVLASPAKPYTAQLVTYRKREYAEAELNALQKMGFTGFIVQKGEYFQVYSGQYASKEEAKKDLAAFQARYKDSFLTRRG